MMKKLIKSRKKKETKGIAPITILKILAKSSNEKGYLFEKLMTDVLDKLGVCPRNHLFYSI